MRLMSLIHRYSTFPLYKDGAFLTIDIDRVKREVEAYALPLLFG